MTSEPYDTDSIDPFEDATGLLPVPNLDEAGERAKSELIDRYVRLRDAIREAESELEEVKDLLRGYLDDGELVSNGTYMAAYSVRRTYEYNVAAVRHSFPQFFDFACSIDAKRAAEAIRMGLASEEQLDPIRELKEVRALVVRTVGNE